MGRVLKPERQKAEGFIRQIPQASKLSALAGKLLAAADISQTGDQ